MMKIIKYDYLQLETPVYQFYNVHINVHNGNIRDDTVRILRAQNRPSCAELTKQYGNCRILQFCSAILLLAPHWWLP